MIWSGINELRSKSYICGYCGEKISTNKGYWGEQGNYIYICHVCESPTYFDYYDNQMPGEIYGVIVNHVSSDEVKELYEEARRCISINAYTSAVICCRKLLMNIAVSLEAEEGKSFAYYVEYLNDKGYIPPNGKKWVDKIRIKGNEANHEIKIMNIDDAKLLIDFVGMLMKFIYEFPAMIEDGE